MQASSLATAPQATTSFAGRSTALDLLADFLPRAGSRYAEDRNFDRGPDDRSNVSGLSPYLRRRLITEREVARAVLEQHSARAAEMFLQEVYWRTYWKGWLEMRPQVWGDYLAALRRARDDVRASPGAISQHEAAVLGATGIDCFDAWARELRDTGYLHNHARMWFASIWIFTLRLPWVLGADFFYRYLLDADPASNTLSWRWVAGLHTRGKNYVARADNIAKFTRGRFNPVGQLDESPQPVAEWQEVSRRLIPPSELTRPGLRTAVLHTEDDLRGDVPGGVDADAHFLLAPTEGLRSARSLSFSCDALGDTFRRLEESTGKAIAGCDSASHLCELAQQHDVQQVVAFHPGVGETSEVLRDLRFRLAESGVRLVLMRRRWDSELFPHATAGYFRFKKHLPSHWAQLA
ncbi:MAG: FAD-binding domain-containing protein [Acidobacteriota bacterium]